MVELERLMHHPKVASIGSLSRIRGLCHVEVIDPTDDFGESVVSLSGDGSIPAVGADEGNYVVVFRNDGTDWVQPGQTIRGEALGDFIHLESQVSLSFATRSPTKKTRMMSWMRRTTLCRRC